MLAPRNIELILGLLEDWAQGVNWLLQYPLGAKDSAEIAFSLLPMADDWRHWERETDKRLLKVIAKIPRGSPERIKDLAKRAEHGRDDRVADEFAELVLKYLDGIAMGRDFPEEVIQMAETRWGISRKVDEGMDRSGFRDHFDVEVAFGLPETMSFDFFPQSAYHGPFWSLLVHHPNLAVAFILRLMNLCVDRYGDPNIFHRFIELPGKASLILPDGTVKEQWCSWRLWGLYRGVTVGPKVLECAVMALERWLLDVCRKNPKEVEPWLVNLLNQSNNVAITAVVASVSIAHPELAGIAGPVLLTSHQLIEMDRARMGHDSYPIGKLLGEMPHYDMEHAFFEKERKEADGLEHRRGDLEYLAIQLQTGPQRGRVAEILDNYQRELPAVEKQSEADKLWRLALLRMDLRDYELKGQTEDGKQLIGPKQPAPDVQAVLDAHAPRQNAFAQRIGLVNWAMGVFKREEKPQADPNQWREHLTEAQQIYESLAASQDAADTIDWRMAAAGPAYAAAVLIRDHWSDLTDQERDWAARVIVESVTRDADSEDQLFICARNPMDASRPAAFILPVLFNNGLAGEREKQVLHALSLAITHASGEVRDYVAEGIGDFLWKTDRALTLTCIGALTKKAEIVQEAEKMDRLKPFGERTDIDSKLGQGRTFVKEAILARKACEDEQGLFRLDLGDWPAQRALHYLLPIFAYRTEETIAKQFFYNVSQSLARWWRMEREQRRDHSERRNYQLEHSCTQRLTHFVLQLAADEATRICGPLVSLAAKCPKETAEFVKQLIIQEDVVGSGVVFWTLWQNFADRTLQAPWAASLDDRHSDHILLIDALFLAVSWNEGVRHWQRLTGNEARLNRLFEALPPTAPLLVAYSRYLFKVGEKSLPEALILVSNKLRQAGANSSMLNSDAQFYLESIMRRWVLSQPGRLKEKTVLKEAILHVLDELVEAGSSIAYRLRDDFVTPVQAVAVDGSKETSESGGLKNQP